MKAHSKFYKKNIFLTIITGLVLLFFLIHRGFVHTPGRLEAMVSSCMYPFLLVQNRIITPLQQKIIHRKNLKELQETVQDLQQENQDLLAQVAALQASELFAQETKELITFKERYKTDKAHLCQIIQKRLTSREQVLFVDAGSKHGIVKDMAAVYKNNIIGKVVHVYPRYSQVLLVTDARCKVAVYCSITKTEGLYQGANTNEYALLTHVDRLKKIKEKEKIVSSGQGTIFPRGFTLGTIESFVPQGVHYHIKIQPAIDSSSLKYCYLIQK